MTPPNDSHILADMGISPHQLSFGDEVVWRRYNLTRSYMCHKLTVIQHPSYLGVSENSDTPKSSIQIGFSIINHPFWGTRVFWKHPFDCHKFFFVPMMGRNLSLIPKQFCPVRRLNSQRALSPTCLGTLKNGLLTYVSRVTHRVFWCLNPLVTHGGVFSVGLWESILWDQELQKRLKP